METLMQFLQTFPQFSGFTQSELIAFDRAFRVDTYPDGHVFFKDGEHADEMYLILRGEVEISRRRRNRAGYALVNRMRAGEIFGHVSLINNDRRRAMVAAVAEVRVAALPRSAFELLLDTHAPIALHFQHLIARQLARDLRLYDEALRAAARSGEVSGIVSTFGSS